MLVHNHNSKYYVKINTVTSCIHGNITLITTPEGQKTEA